MNKDVFEGKWKQIRGEAKAWWGKLTDDDLYRAAGKFDALVGLLQEKYGYTRQQAAEEVDKRLTDYEANLKKMMGPASKSK
ncbi:MAG TPA: CsbD family protein [Anaerolineales bacterium]